MLKYSKVIPVSNPSVQLLGVPLKYFHERMLTDFPSLSLKERGYTVNPAISEFHAFM
jgi:hypothetical protein